MKNSLLRILSTLSLAILLTDISLAQCNVQMAGQFTQSDSCTGYVHAQSSNVYISTYGAADIEIANFGGFVGYTATVTLNCSDHTVELPFQTFGMTNVYGSGTFSSDYNSMTISFSVDFGGNFINCVDYYTRSNVGISSVTNTIA